jgi:polyhydroxyalkanoate synthase
MNVIPIDIRPDRLAQEMFDYSQKLGQGIENLLNADQIDTGVTPRVEI